MDAMECEYKASRSSMPTVTNGYGMGYAIGAAAAHRGELLNMCYRLRAERAAAAAPAVERPTIICDTKKAADGIVDCKEVKSTEQVWK